MSKHGLVAKCMSPKPARGMQMILIQFSLAMM
ncbi:hypothetical protein SB6419_05484 [Klebsiella spallanzanii]|nr:hypothetical protein SB6419_05484 [Klebsiella spallanzanii]